MSQRGEFLLGQNYPNPFNPTTTIQYTVGVVSLQPSVVIDVRLAVFDLLGREISTLVNGRKTPGRYAAKFDASGLPTGVYIYRLTAGQHVESRAMVLIK
jgi:hypothetical protein